MRGRTTVIIIVSITIYWLLLWILYFAPLLFSFSFGGKQEWYFYVIAFLRNYPFGLISGWEITTFIVAINTLFWTVCLASIFWFLIRDHNRGKE